MLLANGASPTFIATDPADADILRRLGASVWHVSELHPGAADGDVVLIARGDGRDLLMSMNLGATGRFLDLDADASLEALIQGHPEPLGLLDEMAHDIFWHEERPLGAWPVPAQPEAQPCGFPFLQPYLRWVRPELGTIVGPYASAKSTLSRLLGYRWADTVGRNQNARVSIVAWEDKLHTIKREVMRYSLGGDVATLNSAQAKRLADMEQRIGWTQRHPDDARLIQWYCELVEHRAKHDGVRFFIFDPFNEHDSTRAPNQTETEYVREMMIKFRRLAHGLGIILIVVTHVSARSYDETGKIKPFRIANASGSVQFGNKCDRGICILRTGALSAASMTGASEHMVLHFDKCKDEEVMGRRGTIACVFDPRRMTLELDEGATAEARKLWP
jgi:hypothetical protein